MTDFTDSVTSGDTALGLGGGGCLALKAVKGYMPYLKEKHKKNKIKI